MIANLAALGPLRFVPASPIPEIDAWASALAIRAAAERLSSLYDGCYVDEQTIARLAQAPPRVLLALRWWPNLSETG